MAAFVFRLHRASRAF